MIKHGLIFPIKFSMQHRKEKRSLSYTFRLATILWNFQPFKLISHRNMPFHFPIWPVQTSKFDHYQYD